MHLMGNVACGTMIIVCCFRHSDVEIDGIVSRHKPKGNLPYHHGWHHLMDEFKQLAGQLINTHLNCVTD